MNMNNTINVNGREYALPYYAKTATGSLFKVSDSTPTGCIWISSSKEINHVAIHTASYSAAFGKDCQPATEQEFHKAITSALHLIEQRINH